MTVDIKPGIHYLDMIPASEERGDDRPGDRHVFLRVKVAGQHYAFDLTAA